MFPSVIINKIAETGGIVAHRTRYHGPGSWPPAFNAILTELVKLQKTRGFTTGKEGRGLCMRADKRCTKGPADETLRFLENVGVLIPRIMDGKRRLLIDHKTIKHTLGCVASNSQPRSPSEQQLRQRAEALVKAIEGRRIEKSASNSPSPVRTIKDTPVAPTATRDSEEPRDDDAPACMVEEPSEREVPMSTDEPPPEREAPMASIMEAVMKKQETPLCVAMFLPPGASREVWTYLFVSWTRLQNGEVRVPIPNDGVPSGLECDRVEFDNALERFVRAGVVKAVGESGNDNTAYEFYIPPNSIHMIEIPERKRVEVSSVWTVIADKVRNWHAQNAAKLERGLLEELAGWLKDEFPELNSRTALLKLVGYAPQRRETEKWGIFVPCPEKRGFYLPTLMGFEPYELVGVERDPSHRGRPAKSLTVAPTEVHSNPPTNAASEREAPVQPMPAPQLPAPQLPASAALEWVRIERERLERIEMLLKELLGLEARRAAIAREFEELGFTL